MRSTILVAFTCLTLAACAEGRQRGVESRKLDSGVTSSTGGGQDFLKNSPNVGITPGTGVNEKGGQGRSPQPAP